MNAENIYVDPSALSLLFFHQEASREMSLWRRRTPGPLLVTHHGRTEVVNAIALARFRGELNDQEANDSWEWLEGDFRNGAFNQVDILWRASLNRAAELSGDHTPRIGSRSLDVLHVACALELNLRYFLTLDDRQQNLAARLKVINL